MLLSLPLVQTAEREEHLIQLYEADKQALFSNVTDYLHDGLKRGEGALVIAVPKHSEILDWRLRKCGIDVATAENSGQLVFLDPQETLSKFVVDGQPDWALFERAF